MFDEATQTFVLDPELQRILNAMPVETRNATVSYGELLTELSNLSDTISLQIAKLNRTIEQQKRELEGMKIQISELKRDRQPV